MEYTSALLVDFLKKLIVFDKNSRSAIEAASHASSVRGRESRPASPSRPSRLSGLFFFD